MKSGSWDSVFPTRSRSCEVSLSSFQIRMHVTITHLCSRHHCSQSHQHLWNVPRILYILKCSWWLLMCIEGHWLKENNLTGKLSGRTQGGGKQMKDVPLYETGVKACPECLPSDSPIASCKLHDFIMEKHDFPC